MGKTGKTTTSRHAAPDTGMLPATKVLDDMQFRSATVRWAAICYLESHTCICILE
jgi:hypothetical protein